MLLQLLFSTAFAQDIDTHLVQIEKKYKDVQGLRADFTQETSNAMLKKPMVQEGTLTVSRPGLLHWRIDKPMEQHYYADKDKITVWTPSQNQAIISSNQEKSTDISNLLTNLNALRDQYKIELVDEENKQVHLKLSGKDANTATGMGDGSIQLWFSQSEYVLQQVLVDTPNASTKVTFQEVRINPEFSQSEFVFVPTDGVDVHDSRQ